jgi:hypothetical protein
VSTPRIGLPRELRLELQGLGFDFLRRSKHSYIFDHPCGARAYMPTTPSDHRSVANCLADAKRALRENGIDPDALDPEDDDDDNEAGRLVFGRAPREVVVLRYGLTLVEEFDLAHARRTLRRAGTVQEAKRLLRDLAAFARGEERDAA